MTCVCCGTCYRDDTIQVIEMHRRNTGRDPFPLLLSRGKLPKTPNVPPVGGFPVQAAQQIWVVPSS